MKLDFIAGLLLKAVEATGSKDFRGVQANVGEVLVWRNLFWGLSEAMVRNPKPWIGDYLLPDIEPAGAYQIISTMAYTKVKYIIEQTVASGLIYLNSSARDFKNPEIRPYLDKYMRGSNGYDAEEPREAAQAVVGLRSAPNSAAATNSTRSTTAARPRKSGATCCSVRMAGGQRRQAQGLCRAVHGGIRSRRLEGAGSHGSGRTQLSRHARAGPAAELEEAALMVGVVSTGAMGQAAEPTFKGDPDVYKVIFEDANFRVIEATRKKGIHDKAHGHPVPSIVYSLTDCKTKQYAADGKTPEGETKAGSVGPSLWSRRILPRTPATQTANRFSSRRSRPATDRLEPASHVPVRGLFVAFSSHHPEDRQHQHHLGDPAAGERQRAQHGNTGRIDQHVNEPAPEKEGAGECRRGSD